MSQYRRDLNNNNWTLCGMRWKLPHSKEGSEKRSRCGVRGPKRNKQKTPNIATGGGGSSGDIPLGSIIGVPKSHF